MTCEELLRILGEHVEGDIDPSICDEFEHHLEDCEPCQVVVDTLRNTVSLYSGSEKYEIPVDFRRRLHDTLRCRWTQLHNHDDA